MASSYANFRPSFGLRLADNREIFMVPHFYQLYTPVRIGSRLNNPIGAGLISQIRRASSLKLVRPAATARAHLRSFIAFGEETLASCLTRVGGSEIGLGGKHQNFRSQEHDGYRGRSCSIRINQGTQVSFFNLSFLRNRSNMLQRFRKLYVIGIPPPPPLEQKELAMSHLRL